MKTFLKIAIPLGLLLTGAWFFLRPASPFSVEIVHPEHGPALQAVYATGSVEATIMLPIAARNTARLTELTVDEGSNVAKGQLLARLEDADLQKSLEELKAKANFAKRDYDRKAALAKQGYETKATLDQARSAWEAASAAVDRADAEAGFMKLTAPADGRIIRRDGEIGQMIAANQPLFWLTCCAPLRVSAEVDEEDIVSVQPGQEVLIRADAFPGKVFHGKVQSITPMGDPVARSYRVRIGFTEDTPLQIGMTAEANIVVGRRENAMLLPSSAVTRDDKVWTVRDGRLSSQAVVAGARGAGKTEIVSGLSIEDAVVLKPKADMAEGRKVRTKTAP